MEDINLKEKYVILYGKGEKDKFDAIRNANKDNVSDKLEDLVNDNELLSQLLSL